MTSLEANCPPVLSCDAARSLESSLFEGDEAREWAAMQHAGRAVANAVLRDFLEIGGLSAGGRILVLAGKGHNRGDALIAATAILERFSDAQADVLFAFGERTLRPLAARAWRNFQHAAGARVNSVTAIADRGARASLAYDVCLDGIFGFQFRPPADPRIAALIARVNESDIRLRAAVDLPSADLFRADFTYATGSVKAPLLDSNVAGRIRYLDLGFFRPDGMSDIAEVVDLVRSRSETSATSKVDPRSAEVRADDRVLTDEILGPLRALRPAMCDKRSYGHVFLLGGSRGFPGAIFMAVEAAIRSGAGLVTAFVPESLAPNYAARLPEAIWVGWPETPTGGLALEGEYLLRERLERADALVIGPGMGREPETLALAAALVKASQIPLAIDADALQREVVGEGTAPRVVTPHAGEFKRIAGEADLREFASRPNLTVVLKGPVTRLCDGGPIYHSFFGGPVLARGGSGDLLAGMIGTQLAQTPENPLAAAARAVVWHGRAAEALARNHGQVAVHTTQLMDFLGTVLREE